LRASRTARAHSWDRNLTAQPPSSPVPGHYSRPAALFVWLL
jgi:hypothetical protein